MLRVTLSISTKFKERQYTVSGGAAMRGVLVMGTSVAVLGLGACMMSCSAQREDARELVGVTRQAATGVITRSVVEGSARRVCQMVGDVDHMTGAPMDIASKYGISNTDLGYPVAQGNRTWFLFGDVTGARDSDPLGFTDEKPSGNPPSCPTLRFPVSAAQGEAPDPLKQALTVDCHNVPGMPELSGPLIAPGSGVYGNGFNVPTGFTLDPDGPPDHPGPRLIGLFGFGLNNENPDLVKPVFAEASALSPTTAKSFTCIPTILTELPKKFAMIAPWIADENELGYDTLNLPGSGSKLLLVWGTGIPARGTGVHLAVVRLNEIKNRSAWRFFNGGRSASDKPDPSQWISAGTNLDAVNKIPPIASNDHAGEFSVSYDPTYREWRMVHGIWSPFLDPAERPTLPDPAGNNVTIMRTSLRPEGLWSDIKLLYVMKSKGEPSWGDEGEGLFLHDDNQRAYAFGNAFRPLSRDPRNPYEPPLTCATSFPAWCPPSQDSRTIQNPGDPDLGCCTQSDHCCDGAFHFGFGPAPGSWGPGVPYGQYLIPSFTQNFATPDPNDPLGRFPRQRVFWTMSTLNPYVVVLMSTDLVFGDLDGDGTPNEEDNCPLTFNPGQENCNADAEVAEALRHGRDPKKALLGDACDPVPCPRGQMDTVRLANGCEGVDPYDAQSICFGREIRDVVKLAPVGPGFRENRLTDRRTTPRSPDDYPNITAPTHARFCQQTLDDSDPARRFDCNNPTVMVDAQLVAFASAEAEVRDPANPWHRVSLSVSSCFSTLGSTCRSGVADFAGRFLGRGQPFDARYGINDINYWPYYLRWHYDGSSAAAADLPFWNATTPPRIPDASVEYAARCRDASFGPGTCLDGRMWLHAETEIGKPNSEGMLSWIPWTDKHGTTRISSVGTHGDTAFDDQDFANNYVSVKPDKATVRLSGGLRLHQQFMRAFTEPDPRPEWRGYEGGTVPLIRDGSRILGVFDDGRREDVSFIASSELRAKLLDSDLLWVSPAEASPFAGARTRPHALALSSDGTRVLSAPVREEGRWEESLGRGECGIGLGDSCLRARASSGASTASQRSPAPRSNFVAVYSRVDARLFVIGGRDGATGAALDEIWMYRVDDGQWSHMPVPGWLGSEVLAATFSWRDGCLWILARDPADVMRRTTRLLRIETGTGHVSAIATGVAAQPSPRYNHRGLFLDMDGNIGLFGSSERSQKHRVAVIIPRPGGYDVKMTRRRDRHLSAEPIVDLRGVALFYEPDRPPVEKSKDADDDVEPGDRTHAASRLRKLPLYPETMSRLEDLLR